MSAMNGIADVSHINHPCSHAENWTCVSASNIINYFLISVIQGQHPPE